MKKVVLLAPYFLPRRRVGSWRPFKFAIHLKEFGWEPHIITIRDLSGALTDKERHLLSGIPIFEITPPFDFTSRSDSTIATNTPDEKSGTGSSRFEPALHWIDKHFPIDTWLPLFWLRKNKILQFIRDINPEMLWSTGDPWSSHWLAGRIQKNTQLPWVADFRDPWALGQVNLKRRSSFSTAMDKKAEYNVIKNATAVTFTSKRTEQLYKDNYKKLNPKTATIYNCFDRLLYNEKANDVLPYDDKVFNLVFFGKFRRLSPARPLVDILANLKEQLGQSELPLLVHSFGPLSVPDKAYAQSRGVLSYFKTQAPIAPEKTLSVLSKADLLWLSTDPGRENIIPAKLWDYLAAGRPVLSIAPNPEIAAILDQTGAGIQLDHHNITKVAHTLRSCILAKQAGKPLPIAANSNQEMIEKYEARKVTAQLAALFDQLV